MKFRHIISAVAALCVLATTGCTENKIGGDLDNIQVSASYVSIPQNMGDYSTGGSATITVTATGSWSFGDIPAWLTVSPTSGGAGDTKVTFSAGKAVNAQSVTLKINADGNTQYVVVSQPVGDGTASAVTVAEINAGPDGKKYQVTGTCVSIANTTYGNWYLEDNTGKLYIYGTLDKNGAEKNFTSLGLEVGDVVTVEGPKTTYSGTVELVNVTVVKIVKSLIKLEETAVTVGREGGKFSVGVTVKGSDLHVEGLPEWLAFYGNKGGKLEFSAAENIAGARTASLSISSGTSTVTLDVSQDGVSGTLEMPMTPEEAIAAANAGVTSAVYIKGIVSKVLSGGYGAQYGNASFWISADGKFNDNLALDFEVYQANWLGAVKWVEGNAQIAEGAEVIVYGPLTTYKGTAETQGKGAAHVYSVNGVKSDADGIGTLEFPFKPAGACVAANAGTAAKVYVAGKISELVSGGMSANYGNGSFWISEDGVKHGDLSVDFEAYQVNWLGGQKWVERTHPQVEVGADVVIYGPLTTYKGTAETQGKGAAYVYSYNGQTE